jgi:hypothetical protein
VPDDEEDLKYGFQVLKLFLQRQQTLIEEGRKNLEETNKTLGFIEETTGKAAKMTNRYECCSWITKVAFGTTKLNEILTKFMFPVTRLGDEITSVGDYFKQ